MGDGIMGLDGFEFPKLKIGFDPKPSSINSSSVTTTSFGAFSYNANSLIKSKTFSSINQPPTKDEYGVV